jgi:hypothetical protein
LLLSLSAGYAASSETFAESAAAAAFAHAR